MADSKEQTKDIDSALASFSAPPLNIAFHPSIVHSTSATHGAGFLSTNPIGNSEALVRTPFTSTISILSIPYIDPPWPVSFFDLFEDRPEIITRFLLLELRAQGETGKWWDYINSLPKEFDTPLWWSDEDRTWLEGTNLYGASQTRYKQWMQEYKDGMHHLMPTLSPELQQYYTWEIYLWASTVLSSRSFSQEVVRSYKEPCQISSHFANTKLAKRWLQDDKNIQFPVLLPGLDLANHDPTVEAVWISADGAVTFNRQDDIGANVDICNNYGAKGTEELLLGYGFMLESNNADFVVLSTTSVEADGVGQLPQDGDSYDRVKEKPFQGRLYMPDSNDDPDNPGRIIQRSLLPSDIMKLAGRVANERELLQIRPAMPEMSTVPPAHTRRLNRMVDSLILSLEDRKYRLEETTPNVDASNHRQQMAMLYRESQINILDANIDFLTNYIQSLQSKQRIMLLTSIVSDPSHPTVTTPLLSLLAELLGTKVKAKSIRARGLHEFAFTVWIGSMWLQWESNLLDYTDLVSQWIRFATFSYGTPRAAEFWPVNVANSENAQTINSYLALVKDYGQKNPESLYADSRWNEDIFAWSLKVWRQESIVLKSLQRIVRNGNIEEDEDMLFLEHQ